MRKLLLANVALVALIVAGPAMAADQGIRAPAPAYAPVSDWTGFYVGGHVGYGWGHDPYTDNGFSQSAQGNVSGTAAFNINPATLTGTDPKGAVGGGHFGYNQQWGNWVGGLEIDISATDMKATTAASSRTVNTATLSVVPPITSTTTLTTGVSEEDKFDLLGTARAAWRSGLVEHVALCHRRARLDPLRSISNRYREFNARDNGGRDLSHGDLSREPCNNGS
jgi:opacity protein-like surface antigen